MFYGQKPDIGTIMRHMDTEDKYIEFYFTLDDRITKEPKLIRHFLEANLIILIQIGH